MLVFLSSKKEFRVLTTKIFAKAIYDINFTILELIKDTSFRNTLKICLLHFTFSLVLMPF